MYIMKTRWGTAKTVVVFPTSTLVEHMQWVKTETPSWIQNDKEGLLFPQLTLGKQVTPLVGSRNVQVTYKLQYSLSKNAKQKVMFTVHDCHCCP